MDYGHNVNRSEIAEIIGVSLPTIDSWIVLGCPYEKRGRKGASYQFNTAKVIEWHVQRVLEDNDVDAQRASLEEAKRRKMVAQAELAELSVATRRKQLVTIDSVTEEIGIQLSRVRSKILSVPALIGSQTKSEQAQQIAQKVISDALTEIISHDSRTPNKPGSNGNASGNNESGGKRELKATTDDGSG